MRLLYLLCALYCPLTFAISEPEVGKERMHVALIRKIYPLESIDNWNSEFIRATKRARVMEDFWRYYARDVWDIKVNPYLLITQCVPSSMFCKSDIRATSLDEDYFQIWYRTRGNGYCGWGEVGGAWSSVFEGCTANASIHELGHNFSLRHANRDNKEYADITSIMGGTATIPGLHSMNMVQLGLAEWEPITYSQQVQLVPIELSIDSLHEDDHQFVLIKDMAISLRKGRGFKYKPAAVGDEIYIHERGWNNKSNLVAKLEPGDSYSAWGVRLDYLEYANETAILNVDLDDNIPIDIKKIPLELPCCSVIPESGLYWNPDFDGQGFSVHRKGDRLAYIWFTYNTTDSARRFYVGNNKILHTTEKGTFEDPMSRTVMYAGLGQFIPGAFIFNTPEHGRGSTVVEPLVISDSGGLWYNPNRDGEGFSIHYIGNKIVAYWFTYGFRPDSGPFTPFKTVQTQRWYMLLGTANYMTIYEPQGGEWLFFDTVGLLKVGTATLIDDVFTFEMEDNSGSIELKQLF